MQELIFETEDKPRGSGKTYRAVLKALELALEDKKFVFFLCQNNVTIRYTMEMMRDVLEPCPPIVKYKTNKATRSFVFENGSRIRFISDFEMGLVMGLPSSEVVLINDKGPWK